MRVDGREIGVSGSLLQPMPRRTNDILRLILATVLLALIITSSLITRPRWVALEKSISEIVGVLSPTQSNLVYLIYGIAILALPFVILIALIIGGSGNCSAPTRPPERSPSFRSRSVATASRRPGGTSTSPTVSTRCWRNSSTTRGGSQCWRRCSPCPGPWLPARWRHWWWTLLLAFVPIHLVVSAVVPDRAVLGLAVGWVVGSLVVLVVGTPALEVPLDDAVRAMARRGFLVSGLRVVRPAGPGPLVLSAACAESDAAAVVELYGPHQRSGGTLRQLWRKFRLRGSETAPLQTSMRRAVEHRALMAIAIGDLGVANTSPIAVAELERGWTLYAHKAIRGVPITECAKTTAVSRIWESLATLHDCQISHGDLSVREITVDDGTVLFGGFGSAEYGATDIQLQSDLAQLLVTTSALYDAESAVGAAIDAFGKDAILTASRRLTKAAVPARIRDSVDGAGAALANARAEVMRQTGADQIKTATITRFTRGQVVQLVLLGALVYVAYPFISTAPTFFSGLKTANWSWALLGLTVSALTYVGAAAALWASTDGTVNFWKLSIAQVANTFAATTTPAGVGGLALSTRFLQKNGLSTMRATAAVALQQTVQVIMHVLLLIFFSAVAGVSADLSHFVPKAAVLYLIAGVALGIVGAFLFVPKLRKWLATDVRPRLKEVAGRPRRPRPPTPTIGIDRTRLYRNNSRRGAGAVGQRRGLRWRCVVRHLHRGDDGRRDARFGRTHTGGCRCRRGGADRWSRGVRGTRVPSACRRFCCIAYSPAGCRYSWAGR